MPIKSNMSLKVQDTLNKNKIIKAKDCKLWLSELATKKAFITVRIVSEKNSAELNKQFRKIDKPTNILSFLIKDTPLIGDLILCHPIIKEEAKKQNKEIISHYAHLIIHGYLHLLGYDHENDKEAIKMEAKEIQVLGRLGFPNPYTSNII
ncbi:rRNA maturation RNase YbeY [Methylophilaceae bacterium]|jgi:probable rRNA maturation factor|nr:rRNA maturation RNase YbeY [Methylophilaceae bacterium]